MEDTEGMTERLTVWVYSANADHSLHLLTQSPSWIHRVRIISFAVTLSGWPMYRIIAVPSTIYEFRACLAIIQCSTDALDYDTGWAP